MRFVLFLILLVISVNGCISPTVKTGDISLYELPGINNTTIFYLNLSSTHVIDSIVNRTSADYLIEDNIRSFRNPVAVNYSGANASVNISIRTIAGRNYAHFNFSSNFSGFVAYTIPGDQDFTYQPVDNKTIRAVLPNNFTTEMAFLGYVRPKPDNITYDRLGREVLTWDNPQNEKIRVRYYHIDTPRMLMYLFGFLLICAVIVWVYYYYSISALKKKRKMLEKNIRK